MGRWKTLPLWQNQRRAIKHCLEYLESPTQSALVQMPTGTGKTGVIAILCAEAAPNSIVLVISPSRALAEQLQEDIGHRFFDFMGAPEYAPKNVRLLLPSDSSGISEIDRVQSDLILVSTFQSVTQIRRESMSYFDDLKRRIGLVLVDEGHREPAKEWGDTVREIGSASVLFSATPYRNDLRVFNVSSEHVSYFSYDDALSEKLIRSVRFIDARASNTDTFTAELLDVVAAKTERGEIDSDARIIIRCGDEDSIREMYDSLNSHLHAAGSSHTCVAVHHTFANEDDDGLVQQLNLRQSSAKFFIHQYKLLEGVDDPRCSILAIFDDFKSDRQLVQQIGRVIRNPQPGANSNPAIIFTADSKSAELAWTRYLQFDRACAEHGGNPFLRNTNFLDEILGSLPGDDYIDGKFRKRAEFSAAEIIDELSLPRSAIIYRTKVGFSLEETIGILEKGLEDADRTVVRSEFLAEHNVAVFLSVLVRQTPLLDKSAFPDLRLTATVAKVSGNYLFLYDNAGLWIDDELTGANRLGSVSLQSLFPDRSSVTIGSLTVKNGDISQFSVRSRTFSAVSLAESVPFMGDNTNFITRVSGRPEAGVRRYLGLSRGRVRDEVRSGATISDFSNWTDEVAAQLDQSAKPIPLFQRFATPAEAPDDPTPINILIDADEIEPEFKIGNSELELGETCCDIEERTGIKPTDKFAHHFFLAVNDQSVSVAIRYDDKRKRYLLKSRELSRFVSRDNSKLSLLKALNRTQPFRIVPNTPGTLYAYRHFYSTELKFGVKSGAAFVLDMMTALPELNLITTEKGKGAGTYNSWRTGSLFRFLDESLKSGSGSPFGATFDGIVCEDMGTELADFIAYSTETPTIVFVHAKAGSDSPGVTASKLQEVCGQAVKNLEFLRFGGDIPESKADKWKKPWKASTKKDRKDDPGYEVRRRIRVGPSATHFRAELRSLLRQPNVKREVWIVLGNIFSKDAFQKMLTSSSKTIRANGVQAFFLLASTFSACKSVGVDLRIFCSDE